MDISPMKRSKKRLSKLQPEYDKDGNLFVKDPEEKKVHKTIRIIKRISKASAAGGLSPGIRKKTVIVRKSKDASNNNDSQLQLEISSNGIPPKGLIRNMHDSSFNGDNERQSLQNIDEDKDNKVRKSHSLFLRNSKQQIEKESQVDKDTNKNMLDLNIYNKQQTEGKVIRRSILKRSVLYNSNITPKRLNSHKLQTPTKKQVRFEVKINIHEYEKNGEGSESSNGEESQEDQQQQNEKILEEQRNYLYSKKEIDLLSSVRKPFHKFIIPPDDPMFKFEYNFIFLKDKDMKKRLYSEFKMCKIYTKNKDRFTMNERTLHQLMSVYARKANVMNFTQKPDGSKRHTRKTIVFDLDSTLIKSQYKKHKLGDYDSFIYITLLGTKRIRLYISFRPFVREMLEQLRADFELVLYSSQSKEYTTKIAELLTINPTDQYPSVFHQILTKDDCIYNEELDQYISDLEVLTENRNLKDIIMITDNFTRVLKQPRNIIPVKSFNGSKKDYSLVALGRYLLGFIRTKDVREKIQLDFKTIDI